MYFLEFFLLIVFFLDNVFDNMELDKVGLDEYNFIRKF